MAGDLSGGQRSRLSLAIALLGAPELLVLDEPTVGLDPVLRVALWELFAELAAEGVTLLVSSHVMDEATRCDRLILMREGEIIAQETPASLLAAHRNRQCRGRLPGADPRRAGTGGGTGPHVPKHRADGRRPHEHPAASLPPPRGC